MCFLLPATLALWHARRKSRRSAPIRCQPGTVPVLPRAGKDAIALPEERPDGSEAGLEAGAYRRVFPALRQVSSNHGQNVVLGVASGAQIGAPEDAILPL